MPISTTAISKLAVGTGFALAALSASATAQTVLNAPDRDVVYETYERAPVERSGTFSGLPGVDISNGAGKVRVQGPGGLENNVGAIGMSAPSTSSANPLPLQNDTATTGGAIAVGR